MLTIFTLPEGYFASTTGIIGAVFTDFKPLIILGFAIPLSFYLFNKVIGAIKSAAR